MGGGGDADIARIVGMAERHAQPLRIAQEENRSHLCRYDQARALGPVPRLPI